MGVGLRGIANGTHTLQVELHPLVQLPALICAPTFMQVVLLSGGTTVAMSAAVTFIVQAPSVSYTERIQSLPAAHRAIGASSSVQTHVHPAAHACAPGDGMHSADVTFVTGALDIGRRHASHSFDDDYVQNLRHLLSLRVIS